MCVCVFTALPLQVDSPEAFADVWLQFFLQHAEGYMEANVSHPGPFSFLPTPSNYHDFLLPFLS